VSQVVGLELKLRSYNKKKPFWTSKYESCFVSEAVTEDFSRQNFSEAIADLGSLIILLGMVYIRGESLQDKLEMCELME